LRLTNQEGEAELASYADNSVYLTIGGTQVDAFFKEVSLQASNESVDVTAGSNTDWVERAPGLNEATITISLMYDSASVQTYIQKLAVGQVVTIEYAPEGNTTGKARHVQDFNITQNTHTVSVDKSAVVFEITGESAGAPSVNMYGGGVY
jgi:hypothetical protein